MYKKHDFHVRNNGHSGRCSCGKESKFIEVEFIKDDVLRKENLDCCMECFMNGIFVRERFFMILGLTPGAIGEITAS